MGVGGGGLQTLVSTGLVGGGTGGGHEWGGAMHFRIIRGRGLVPAAPPPPFLHLWLSYLGSSLDILDLESDGIMRFCCSHME